MEICSNCQQELKEPPFCESTDCILNLHRKLRLYTEQIESSKHCIQEILPNLVSTINNTKGTVYFCGVGKSGYIARKAIATWQSLGIRAQFLSPQDALHGDIGILCQNDSILYISNSGTTEELITLATYLKRKGIQQILLSNNPTATMKSVVDTNYVISDTKIIEADSHGIIPSVSSMLYMIILDMVGIYISEQRGYKKEHFQLNHPSGELGKKEN